ncbi:hypothetical protein [Rhizobium sp. CCGE531]|uniref:hypothetical protein n=1 Tax=Rhizobium sp. CCGE531 TaxID=2364271 RepID=UPI000EA93DEA|nr:hypothetical protein [Rhizobium sp. CCGE531]AYG66083.1 hypothetical protein CCGE531_08820 [Rhizobium sp. CCGE531]
MRKIDPSGDDQEFSGSPQQGGMRNHIPCGAMHKIALSLVSCRTCLMTYQNLRVIEERVEHDRNSGLMRRFDHYRSANYYVARESAFTAETLGAALERHIRCEQLAQFDCRRRARLAPKSLRSL